MAERIKAFKQVYGSDLKFYRLDVRNHFAVGELLKSVKPDVVVHLAELPSAPYSMMDVEHAVETQYNNIVGTLNILWGMKSYASEAHLVKMGSLGEYGFPKLEIPEGRFEIEYKGVRDLVPFPKQPYPDFYHISKAQDSYNVEFAVDCWKLKASDVMQGVVYGTRTDEMKDGRLTTRFDYDSYFGTVINRFCAQAAIGFPLTVYGSGGQKRGVIALRDSIQCLTLIVENPPEKGEYRVFNQFDEGYTIEELAHIVKKVGDKKGLDVKLRTIENPRCENEKPHFKAVVENLRNLGFKPTHTFEEEADMMLEDLIKNRENIKAEQFLPKTKWN
jgi:UDP-sulfoquinovose synthase